MQGQNSGSPMYIAVIDDEIDLVYLFKDALSQTDGVRVFAFTDPEAVVVADYRMPSMMGTQLFVDQTWITFFSSIYMSVY